MSVKSDWRRVLTLFSVLTLVGCAGSGTESNAPGPQSRGYAHFLVLGLADNYTNRAHYERTVAKEIRARGANATAYYEAAGGNKPIDRDSVRSIISAGSFDAVLVTRILDQSASMEMQSGSAAAKVTRRNDRPLDFFRYDYEELDEPPELTLRSQVSVAGEVYRTSDEELIWTVELESPGADNIGELIEETAAGIIRRVSRAGLIRR